jgi:hypothetical protein
MSTKETSFFRQLSDENPDTSSVGMTNKKNKEKIFKNVIEHKKRQQKSECLQGLCHF